MICPQDRSNAFKNVMFSEGASVETALGQGAGIGAARRSGTHSLILLQVLRTEWAGTLFLTQVPFTRHALFAGIARLGAPVNHAQVFILRAHRVFGSEHWKTCKNVIKTMVSAKSCLPQLYCTNNSREHTNVFPSTVQLNIRKVMVAGHTIFYGARSWG